MVLIWIGETSDYVHACLVMEGRPLLSWGKFIVPTTLLMSEHIEHWEHIIGPHIWMHAKLISCPHSDLPVLIGRATDCLTSCSLVVNPCSVPDLLNIHDIRSIKGKKKFGRILFFHLSKFSLDFIYVILLLIPPPPLGPGIIRTILRRWV